MRTPETKEGQYGKPIEVARVVRLESLVVAATATAAYFVLGGQWWIFLALLFVPDVSIVGYLRGPRVGAFVYNLAHSYVGPVAVTAFTYLLAPEPGPSLLGLIWLAHVGIDRSLGYGLKLTTGFKHTHLGTIGKATGPTTVHADINGTQVVS